jgi:hypothetical protein
MTSNNCDKKALHQTTLLSISLILIMVIGLMFQESQTTGSSIIHVLPDLMLSNQAFAVRGEEILISLENSTFLPLTTAQGNQLKVSLYYNVQNASTTGQTINAVMRLYTPNGTLLKTSSFPAGFSAQSSGKTELKSTLTDRSIQELIANVTFTNSAKSDTISNEISIPITLDGLKPEVNSSENSTDAELPPLSPTPQIPPKEEKGEQTISPNLTPNPEATSPGIMPPFG